MKQFILAFSLVAISQISYAQPAQTWDENTGMNRSSENAGKFSATEMTVEKKIIAFHHLPDLSQEISAVITDADGAVVAQKELSRINSMMDVRSLKKGKLYFVTLYYNNKSEKGFTLHL
jgi:hypothetical protein